ncbi:hypothetical protein KQY30_16515 [Streptomyces sp. GMY02]|uniref:hypothetical protein n=1 Tax=Streptomyces sp. GMY02 TaxID=1333528 RepID=UPI001C2C33A5|nr:hypothetical protein [Streptomyces sp. GMY02]QXE35623.1 hypothetical protein KQY30_16515 [Streptomyces sp. GMY02]
MNFLRNVGRAAKAAGAAVAVALGLGLALTVAVPAQADPPAGTYPPLAGVCVDKVTPVLDALGQGIFACYGPSGSPVIKTRPVNCQIARPNGSTAVIDALRADIDAGTRCLDFAGVTRGPLDVSTRDLSWIQFAADGVTAAVRNDSPLSGQPFTLTMLRQIYTCQLGQVAGIPVNPLLPQPGSASRSGWLSMLGISEAQIGACVGTAVSENNGAVLTAAGHIVPFSISSYIAQRNGVEADTRGRAVLVPVDGVAPVTGRGTFNPAFPHRYPVYVVVETARLGNTDINSAFVGTGSQLCGNPAVTEFFGFGVLSNCGTVAAVGER